MLNWTTSRDIFVERGVAVYDRIQGRSAITESVGEESGAFKIRRGAPPTPLLSSSYPSLLSSSSAIRSAIMTATAIKVLRRSALSFFSGLKFLIAMTLVVIFDLGLEVYNSFADKKKPGTITTCGGRWPKHLRPQQGDSRSSCPALNALANHGILPHSGRGISFVELTQVCRDYYNFAPTFCWFVPNYIASTLGRDYATGTLDLEDISVHNGIEHDASLTREDTFHVHDQGKPDPKLVEEVLSCGTGPNGVLTIKDLSKLLSKRRVESRETNGQYSQALIHKLFGSSNSSTLLTHFGGDPAALKLFLLEEKLHEGWEPKVDYAMGITMFKFQQTVLPVEMNIDEGEFKAKRE